MWIDASLDWLLFWRSNFIKVRFGSPERDHSLSNGDMTLEKDLRSQHSKDVPLLDSLGSQGALTSVLEYEWKIKLPLSRVFCGGFCEFLIRAHGKLRGLEPRSWKSGTRKFLGGSDHSPKIIKWQGMKLLTFFVVCLCQLGGTEIRCEEETGSQNARTNLFKNIFFWKKKKKKQKTATQNMKHTTYLLGSWQSPISANEWIVLALFFKTFAARPVVFVT